MLKNSFLGRRDEPTPPVQHGPRDAGFAALRAQQRCATVIGRRGHPAPDRDICKRRPTVCAHQRFETKPGTAATGASAAGSKLAEHVLGMPRLTVGPNIKLKGAEINDCDTLVVEGHVEASMDSKTLEILKTGSYEGTVTIDVAEIHGNLTAT